MFQHWGKQLEIRYLVSDRGQIFKIKMWGKGREGDRGREREWVCSIMYVWCMCVYMYITSQSNNPMKNLIKCATFHLTEILVLVSPREQRNQHSDQHKQSPRANNKELPFCECWATWWSWVPFFTGDWCCCCSFRPWEKACIPFVLHCWVRKQKLLNLDPKHPCNCFLPLRSIFVRSEILIKEYLELNNKPWLEVCFLKWSAESWYSAVL